jgi:hypothetical protein
MFGGPLWPSREKLSEGGRSRSEKPGQPDASTVGNRRYSSWLFLPVFASFLRCPIPIFDTTRLHAQKTVVLALTD